MTPTNKLRFVERSAPYYPGSQGGTVKTILQQWWEDSSAGTHLVNGNPGEWRDIPVEKEALAQPEQEPVACAECERLRGELKKANDQAEHFERAWYLRGDEIERLNAQPEQEPVAWLLTDKNINSLQVDSIQRLIDRLKHAHHTDLCVRINGQDEWFQADWLKHMVRVTPPQRTEQEPEAWMYQEYRDDDQFGWRDEIQFVQPPNDPNYFRNIVPVYTNPPQRTEQEPAKDWVASHNEICALLRQAHDALALTSYPPRRTWVGLTGEERGELVTLHHGWNEYGQAIEAKLKEKNCV